MKPLEDSVAKRLGLDNTDGVLIGRVQLGSAAARAGLRKGQVILEVDRKRVRNLKDYEGAMSAAADKDQVLLRIHDGRNARYVVLRSK